MCVNMYYMYMCLCMFVDVCVYLDVLVYVDVCVVCAGNEFYKLHAGFEINLVRSFTCFMVGGKSLQSFLAVPHAYTPLASISCRSFSLVKKLSRKARWCFPCSLAVSSPPLLKTVLYSVAFLLCKSS